HLRIDNADRRLTPHGRRVGLISDDAWAEFQSKQERLEAMKQLLAKTKLTGEMLIRVEAGGPPASLDSSNVGQSLAQILKRPEVTIEALAPVLRELQPSFFEIRGNPRESALSSRERNDLKSVETEIKYEGYLRQQDKAIERLKKAEQRHIPDWFNYGAVSGLS